MAENQPSIKPLKKVQSPSKEQFSSDVLSVTAHRFAHSFLLSIIGTILGFTAFGGMFLDVYQNLSPSEPVSGEVTLLTIGPEALHLWDSENPNPDVTPRAMLAELISILETAGARTIVLDVLLTSSQDGDDLLAQAIKNHGTVVTAEQFVVNQPRTSKQYIAGTTPQIADVVGVGHANLYFTEPILFTGEMIFRGVHLVHFGQRSSIKGTWPNTVLNGGVFETISPSLSLAGAWLHQARGHDPNITYAHLLTILKENCQIEQSILHCDQQNFPHLKGLRQDWSEAFWLHHFGSERNDQINYVPASRLLMLSAEKALMRSFNIPEEQLPPTAIPEDLKEKLQDKLVVIGRVDRMTAQDADRYPTTYSFPVFSKRDMAGVRIQAHLMEALISGRSLYFLPDWISILLALIVMYGTWNLFHKVSIVHHLWMWLLSSIVLVLFGLLVFRIFDGVVLDLSLPITMSILTLIAMNMWFQFKNQ